MAASERASSNTVTTSEESWPDERDSPGEEPIGGVATIALLEEALGSVPEGNPQVLILKGECPRDDQLPHLDGLRCLLSLWILLDHFVHESSVFGDRANVAVDCFVILSGFVTQWAYGGRHLQTVPAVGQYYFRRIGRVLLPTYISTAAAAAFMLSVGWDVGDAGHLVRCLCFLEPWLEPENWCPNGQTWTIAALIPSWLAYPAWKVLLSTVDRKGGGLGLAGLVFGLWASSLGPSLLLFVVQGGWLSERQHSYSYIWPPSQLADFAMGATAATLARRHEAGGERARRGGLADGALTAVFGTVLLLPSSGYHVGWEPLLNHGLAPALAAFLYGSAAPGGAGYMARLLAWRPLVILGKYSLEVFLFQQPLYWAFEYAYEAEKLVPKWVFATVFVLTLFVLSGLYGEYIDAPYVKWLRKLSMNWARTAAGM